MRHDPSPTPQMSPVTPWIRWPLIGLIHFSLTNPVLARQLRPSFWLDFSPHAGLCVCVCVCLLSTDLVEPIPADQVPTPVVETAPAVEDQVDAGVQGVETAASAEPIAPPLEPTPVVEPTPVAAALQAPEEADVPGPSDVAETPDVAVEVVDLPKVSEAAETSEVLQLPPVPSGIQTARVPETAKAESEIFPVAPPPDTVVVPVVSQVLEPKTAASTATVSNATPFGNFLFFLPSFTLRIKTIFS